MKKEKGVCQYKRIQEYFDGELSSFESDRLKNHLKSCTTCKKWLEEMEFVSRMYKTRITEFSEASGGFFEEARLIGGINRKRRYSFFSGTGLVFKKRFIIPIAAAAIALFVFFVPMGKMGKETAVPSAIVSYFSGNVKDVVIMETPETRQTIIWYQENGNQG
jgi:hypothetical protein